MKDIEIVKYIQEIEEKYPVNTWTVKDKLIWPYIKMVICEELSKENDGSKDIKNNKKKLLFTKLKRVVNAFGHQYDIPANSHSDVLIVHHNNARTDVLDDERCFDHNLDPFSILLGDKYKILSLDYLAGSNKKKTYTKTYFIDRHIDKALTLSKLMFVDKTEYNLEFYENFLTEINDAIRDRININALFKNVMYMSCMADFFKKVIRENQVKFVIAGCGYGTDIMSLFMACYDLNVKCMEVQHGIAAAANHRWYTYWGKLPTDVRRYEMLPDIFWCWSQEDKEVIDSWGLGQHISFVGNRPIIHVIDELKDMTEKHSLSINNNKKNILLSLQPQIDYPKWLVEFIKGTSNKYNWIIRRHPSFDDRQREFIDQIKDINNIYTDGVENILLDKLLYMTDLHITNHSSVCIDALLYGIRSIILDVSKKEYFMKEIENGVVKCADNICDISMAIDQYLLLSEKKREVHTSEPIMKFIDEQISTKMR